MPALQNPFELVAAAALSRSAATFDDPTPDRQIGDPSVE